MNFSQVDFESFYFEVWFKFITIIDNAKTIFRILRFKGTKFDIQHDLRRITDILPSSINGFKKVTQPSMTFLSNEFEIIVIDLG